MPFEGVDAWRWQYFAGVRCPDSVVIPADDATGWRLYPRYRTVYSKLFLCESQGIPSGPHGVVPPTFPVFSKPVMNLHGMGLGSRLLRSRADFDAHFTPGHLWMAVLPGPHISTDVAFLDGAPRWWRHATGRPLPGGTFDYWTVHARARPRLERDLARWSGRHLSGFTGIVNFETLGGRIIECHLRMGSEQWVDLNGPGWLESVVTLYAHKRWRFAHRPRTGYSVVLFARHGAVYAIAPHAVDALRRLPGVSSIQVTFDPARPPERHAMPPGGFRLAIVNCWRLETGMAVRARLRRLFTVLSPNGRGPHLGSRQPGRLIPAPPAWQAPRR